MKKIINVSIVLCFFLHLNKSYSQEPFPNLWKTGKEKIIKNHTILREKGSGMASPYIYYDTKESLINETKKNAVTKMWTKDKLEGELQQIDKSCIGGQINIKIVANSIEGVNTANFTIILQDTTGNELYREKLPESIGTYSVIEDNTFWYNYGLVFIPKEIKLPIRVFVINNLYSDEKYSKIVYLIKN